ncbi:MAG: hypothetical protein IJC72_00345 [Clostridia bacterium]|nr:hypothetical protein [Clostridia bacterium]MBQ4097732.1 hypothetical protein [Clostridia bacterium]
MWVAIILAIIAFAVVLCGIFIALPMCKEYDELMFPKEEKNVDVVADSKDEQKEEISGDTL